MKKGKAVWGKEGFRASVPNSRRVGKEESDPKKGAEKTVTKEKEGS